MYRMCELRDRIIRIVVALKTCETWMAKPGVTRIAAYANWKANDVLR